METYYTVYQITNKINGGFYIGCHKTIDLNDGYMGSGKVLKRAVKKYGIENFEKIILEVFDNSEDMFLMEAILVDEEFVESPDTYNICEGGRGGFGFINRTGINRLWHNSLTGSDLDEYSKFLTLAGKKGADVQKKLRKTDPEYASRQIALARKAVKIKYPHGVWSGRKHTDESKEKMSRAAKMRLSNPRKNSQYGTIWITNGVDNKKIKKSDSIPSGWHKGRVMR